MINAHFSTIENVLISNIANAKDSVKISVAWWTNPNLKNVIWTLFEKGIKIEIILSDDVINFNQTYSFQKFIDSGIEICITRYPNLMHHKFCIIDRRLIITGSYNWTLSAEQKNFENIVVSNELNLVNQYIVEFEKLKQKTEKLLNINLSDFKSYMSLSENETELELLTEFSNEQPMPTSLEDSDKVEIDENIKNQFEKAQLLYLGGKHQNAIDICTTIIEVNQNISDVYDLISACKWRQKKYKEQVENAKKAIELDNLNYSAYNSLGIGYACLKNASKSIENYAVCISAEPEDFIYYRNRATSFLDLENDLNIPKNLRDQFTKKANYDLEKVIELTNRFETSNQHYKLYFSRGQAYLMLDKIYPAKMDLLKALELFSTADKFDQDFNELKEIKADLKSIEKNSRN